MFASIAPLYGHGSEAQLRGTVAMERLLEGASKAPHGAAINGLAAGMIVTLSPNKSTGDRSLVEVIWEVVSINGGHALLACRGLCHLLNGDAGMRLAALHEHEFYNAEALLCALPGAGKH
jgi:hypothetical protein